jgi:hypothetical protein
MITFRNFVKNMLNEADAAPVGGAAGAGSAPPTGGDIGGGMGGAPPLPAGGIGGDPGLGATPPAGGLGGGAAPPLGGPDMSGLGGGLGGAPAAPTDIDLKNTDVWNALDKCLKKQEKKS